MSRRRKRRQRPHEEEGINVLPLMDILFTLLAFFVVLTTSMVLQKGIAVDLAQAQSGERSADTEEQLVISIDASGNYFFEKNAVDRAALVAELSDRARTAPDSRVMINADKNSTHQAVTGALDSARKAGFYKVTITVAPEAA